MELSAATAHNALMIANMKWNAVHWQHSSSGSTHSLQVLLIKMHFMLLYLAPARSLDALLSLPDQIYVRAHFKWSGFDKILFYVLAAVK
jgi:hypothetical protein